MPLDNISKRRQTQLQKERDAKQMLSMWSRYLKLVNSKRGNVELVELPKPVRSGYVRFMVLREDVARSEDARLYAPLLAELQKYQYSKNKDFLKKDYKTGKMVSMEYEPKQITHKRWNELNSGPNKLTAKQVAMFDQFWIQDRDYRGRMLKSGKYVWVFKKMWAFKIKVQPNYITHRMLINPKLESELKELYDKIYGSAYLGPKVFKLMGWKWTSDRDDWEKTRTKILERIIEKEKYTIVREAIGF